MIQSKVKGVKVDSNEAPKILFNVTEEMIQKVAKNGMGRKLSEKEYSSFSLYMLLSLDTSSVINEALTKLLNEFLKNKESVKKFLLECREKPKDPIIVAITESWIQEEAEEEIKRKLTDKEMEEMEEELLNGDDTCGMWTEAIRSAILNVVNNPS